MSEEQPFNYKKFMCLLSCPCTICCGICYMHKHMKNPSNAEKLSEHEAKEYLDQLHGNDKVILIPYTYINTGYYGNMGCGVFKQKVQNYKDFCLIIY